MRSSTAATLEPIAAAPDGDGAEEARTGDAHAIERARPLLGTIVSLRIAGLAAAAAQALADAAFAEIALIHRLMSFQEPGSELSHINRDAGSQAITVHPHTRACLARAIDFARRSGGAFDPVRAGGTWRDIVLTGDCVRTAGRLAIDLSGIAKGHAVDVAGAMLRAGGARSGMVNAGGDLMVFGDAEEHVVLRPAGGAAPALLAIADGALASSDPAHSHGDRGEPQHFDGRTGTVVRSGFVTVCAPRCIDADALTKIVLVLGDAAAPLLAEAGAVAHVHDGAGWRTLGLRG